jgi:hypothetical protein
MKKNNPGTKYRLISIGKKTASKGQCEIVELTKTQTRHTHGKSKGKFKTVFKSVTKHVSLSTARDLGIKV